MRAMVIDDNVKRDLERLAAYAEKHVLSMDELLDMVNKQAPPPGDNKNFVVEIPFGYRVVYTIEDQPAGKVRHLSVSVDKKGKLPSITAVEEIMRMIGFKGELSECKVGFESIDENQDAVNVLEVIR
jgi:hypothetical protein